MCALLIHSSIHPYTHNPTPNPQMAQFAIIFLQSSLAWLEGPACGADYVKALMCGYMGSMVVLFSDFVYKRCVSQIL